MIHGARDELTAAGLDEGERGELLGDGVISVADRGASAQRIIRGIIDCECRGVIRRADRGDVVRGVLDDPGGRPEVDHPGHGLAGATQADDRRAAIGVEGDDRRGCGLVVICARSRVGVTELENNRDVGVVAEQDITRDGNRTAGLLEDRGATEQRRDASVRVARGTAEREVTRADFGEARAR